MTVPLGRALFAEFIGTWFLVGAVGLCVAGGSDFAVTGIASTLMVSIYALGDISGANFNPAVSLCLGLCGKLPWPRVFLYTLVQLLGGLLAGGWARNMTEVDMDLGKGVARLPETSAVPMYAVGIGECLYTAMLCLVVVSVAATKRNQPNNHYGFAIGLSIIAGGHALGKVSGGIMNPAVAVGILLQDANSTADQLKMLPVVVITELVGAALAFGLYRVMHPEEFTEEVDNGAPPGLVSVLCAECTGTFYLVLTVTLNVLGGNPLGAWSIAASLAAMIYALGCVSGGHLNPSVTLAIRLRKKSGEFDWAYPIAQIVGGIIASQLGLILSAKSWGSSPAITDAADFNYEVASACELVFTTVLVFAVLCIATVDGKDTGDMTGFIVGSCVTVGGFAIGRISGASLNPAVTLGLCSSGLLSTKYPMYALCFYLLLELIASIVAASLFFTTHQMEDSTGADQREGYPAKDTADFVPAPEAPAEALVVNRPSRSSLARPAEDA